MQEMAYFYLLKEAVLEKYQAEFPHWDKSIHEFKGREIANFQDQLQREVQGRVSEKWFYTHLKPRVNEKLPRVDMLDMLSVFVGYLNWDDFKGKHKIDPPQAETAVKTKNIQPASPVRKNLSIALAGGAFILLALLAWANTANSVYDYQVCFLDADKKTPVIDRPIEVILLKENESPFSKKASNDGCVNFTTEDREITFVIKAAYYQTDTIRRQLRQESTVEYIDLKTDDYALMIHLVSTGNIDDWKKRRAQLDQMFVDDAVIFQVAADGETGMEMYNKSEFINKLTMPINSLKNIKILNTEHRGDRIVKLRFMVDKK